MQINNILGRPAMGRDFYNRVTEQSRFWRRLNSDNILLLAPRRVGKTSLLRRLEATADQHPFRAIYVSVADRTREIDFILKLYEALAKQDGGSHAIAAALGKVQRRLPKLKKLELAKIVTAEFADNSVDQWRELADALMSALRTTDHQWVFLLDEFPLFVLAMLKHEHGRERTRMFLNWFRETRIDDAAGLSARWVVAGSIGLDTVTARERLGDTINDFAVEKLGPFSREDADRFLCRLADSHRITLHDHVRALILGRIGWLIPYHLQLLFSALLDLDLQEPSASDVERAYQALLAPAQKSSFDWWVQRLHDELGSVDADHAFAVLAAVVRDPNGASSDTLTGVLHSRQLTDNVRHRFLLDALENDGYLVMKDHRYLFRSPLLRDYWRTRVLS